MLDLRKLKTECGWTSVQRIAGQPGFGVEEAEEFFQCAQDLANETGKDVIVGNQDVTDTTETVRSGGREMASPTQSEYGERLVIEGSSRRRDAILQDVRNVKSSPATGPRTDVKDEKVIDEHEAFGKTMEMFDREKRGGRY